MAGAWAPSPLRPGSVGSSTPASVASETFTSTSAPIQYAAIETFEGNDEITTYLKRSRAIDRDLGRWIAGALREAGVRVADPEGGFHLFSDFEPLADVLDAGGIRSSSEVAPRCLDEAGVAFLPGSCFGRPPEERTARLAYVNFDGAQALSEAALRGDDGAGSLADLPACEPTREGVRRLVNWRWG